MVCMSTKLATVKSWDIPEGTGALARDDGLGDITVTRKLLVDCSEMTVGERVAFDQKFERSSDGEWRWTFGDVRPVSESDAAVIELENLCREASSAESDLNVAGEVASEDDVESAREHFGRADTALRSRVPEIGAALCEQGGQDLMGVVLDRIDPKYRATITNEWRQIGSKHERTRSQQGAGDKAILATTTLPSV